MYEKEIEEVKAVSEANRLRELRKELWSDEIWVWQWRGDRLHHNDLDELEKMVSEYKKIIESNR